MEEELAAIAIDAGGDQQPRLAPDQLRAAFAVTHELRYGYREPDAEVELVNMRVSVWGPSPALRPRASTRATARVTETRPVVFAGEHVTATVLRGELARGTRLSGPTVCALPDATLLIPPGWSGEVDDFGSVRLHRDRGPAS